MAIITMGTQTAIAQDIVASEADCVLALKGNQVSLYQAVVAHVDQHLRTDFADCGAERFVVAKKSHGRQEQRIVIPMPAPQDPARLQTVVESENDCRHDADVSTRQKRDLCHTLILSAAWRWT